MNKKVKITVKNSKSKKDFSLLQEPNNSTYEDFFQRHMPHIAEEKRKRYEELLLLMQVPEVHRSIMETHRMLKIIYKEKIEEFFKNKGAAL